MLVMGECDGVAWDLVFEGLRTRVQLRVRVGVVDVPLIWWMM
jgi:hypothetical protein